MRALAAAVLTLALAGCASRIDGPLSPAFGAAVASMDAQIIDPTPAQGVPSTSAAKAALAIGRYERDQVKDPPGAYSEAAGGGEAPAGQGSEPSNGGGPQK